MQHTFRKELPVRAMTPEDLYALKWVGECDISPDGSRVAVVVTHLDRETDGYRSAIWVVDTAGGDPRSVVAAESMKKYGVTAEDYLRVLRQHPTSKQPVPSK